MTTKKQSNIAFILSEAGPQKYKMLLSVIFSVGSGLCKIFPYFLMQIILVELLSPAPDNKKIGLYLFLCFLTIVINVFCMTAGLAFSHIAAFSILFKIREKAIDHMGTLGLGFFQENASGQIKKALDEDIEKLELFIAHQIPDLAESIVTPLFVIIYLMTINSWLSLLLFIPFIVSLLLQSWIYRGFQKRMTEYNQVQKTMQNTIVEYIQGMRVFKAFNLSATTFRKFTQTISDYLKFWIKICDLTIRSYTLGVIIIDTSGLLITIPVGGLLYLNGNLTLSGLIMFLLLSTVFLTTFTKILTMGGNLSKLLVGPSGSGKTTLAMLLGRFWDITQGKIQIDGKNIQSVSVQSLMANTAFVFQDVFMLNDTILNNIKMGMDKTNEEIIEACRQAQIHDFIQTLSQGYDTMVGEASGIKLSGGEKQRIAIARAILKKARLVVLDEITAYSDIENEKNIQLALRNLLNGRTGLIIAHRLYTIQNADQIIVLDRGAIVEKGTHPQLLQQNGLYQKLWQKGGNETC